MYRDQQVRPSFIDDDDIEREARNIYKQTQTRIDAEGGMVHPQHILVALSQQADAKQQRAASLKADSIYKALIGGADFADMARDCPTIRVRACEGATCRGYNADKQ